MAASLTHLGMEAVTLGLEKKMDERSYNATQHVQPWLPKVRVVNNFKAQVKFFLPVYLAVVGFLFSSAFAKPTNPCNAKTQFWVEHEDGSSSCEDCPSCLPGQGLSLECGTRVLPTAKINCLPCQAGVSFSNKHDSSSCTPCSSCADDQLVQQNCTPEGDIKCGKQCYSNYSYYDEDKGDCLPCSKCCLDDQDVVEHECKGKLGAGSDMTCSFHSSVNRCDQSTPSPHKPTTNSNQSTTASDYTNPSQGSTHEHTEPPTTQVPHRKLPTTKTASSNDLLISLGIPVIFISLLIATCLYIHRHKARKMLSFLCCSFGTETGIPEPVVQYRPNGTLGDVVETESLKGIKVCNLGMVLTESMQPLLEKGTNQQGLICSCQDGVEEKIEESDLHEPGIVITESGEQENREENREDVACSAQDSTLLSSLLDDESHLQSICDCLDTPMGGLDYRPVAQHYGLNYYKIENLKNQGGGPSRALIVFLAATEPELTVREFVTVVRGEAKRKDAAKLLQAFDSEKKKETSEV